MARITCRCTGPGAAGPVWFQWQRHWRLLPASELHVGRLCFMCSQFNEECASGHDVGPKASDETPTVVRLRANFENREAIYIEKGALRVRVSHIRCPGCRTSVWATVEEVPTAGLGVGIFDYRKRKDPAPLRWEIGTMSMGLFSDYCWEMGYGGWSLYFHPKVIEGVLDLASKFSDRMDTVEAYNKILKLVQHDLRFLNGEWQPLFPNT